jgi:hypothetical protein
MNSPSEEPLTHRPFMALLSGQGRRKVVPRPSEPPPVEPVAPDRSHLDPPASGSPPPSSSSSTPPPPEPERPRVHINRGEGPYYEHVFPPPPKEPPMAAKQKRRVRRDPETIAKGVKRALERKEGETLQSVADELGWPLTTLARHIARHRQAEAAEARRMARRLRKGRTPPFGVRAAPLDPGTPDPEIARRIGDAGATASLGVDLIAALDAYIDTRVEARVQTAVREAMRKAFSVGVDV